MRSFNNMGAMLAVAALGMIGGDVDIEARPRRRDPEPIKPNYEPRPVRGPTAHDSERLARAEQKRARKAAKLAAAQ